MPKATISFSLPEEREDYERTTKASEAFIVLGELREFLRKIRKYEDCPDAEMKMHERIENELFELINSYGLSDFV